MIEYLSLALAGSVVAVSAPVAAALGQRKATVIENGVDTDRFAPSQEARNALRSDLGLDREFVFLYAGRWAATKGIDILVRAVSSAQLSTRPYQVVLAGEDPPDEPLFLESLIRSAKDTSHISVVGYVRDLPRFLNIADAFILPSRGYEGLPFAFLEALATGLPVLASDLPVHRILVDAAKVGWLFRTGDEADLRHALQMVLEAGIPAGWSEQAREAITQRFNLKRMVDEYAALYTRLASERTE